MWKSIPCSNIGSAIDLICETMDIDPLENSMKKMSGKLDEAIKKQIEYLDKLVSMYAHGDNISTETISTDAYEKVDYLLKLQQKCEDLISTHLEYQPDSDIVKSLGEEFDKLKVGKPE